MPSDDLSLFGNGGAVAVITEGMAALKEQLRAISEEQKKHSEFLIRYDEKQRGWATKHEVAEINLTLGGRISTVEAKAVSAHDRLDKQQASVNVGMQQVQKSIDELSAQISDLQGKVVTREAEVRGGWSVTRFVLSGVGAVTLVVLGALLGRFL